MRRSHFGPTTRRLLSVLAAIVVVALTAVLPAQGRDFPYYYGTLYYNIPNPGQCTYDLYQGNICNGWNYWDYSEIYFYGSGAAYLGFIFNNGSGEHYKFVSGSNVGRTVAWNDPDWSSVATHYNRCFAAGSYSVRSSVDAICQIYP